MKTGVALFTLCLLLAATGCQKDFPVDSKYTQPKLVINCLFDQNSNWKVYITASYNLSNVTDELAVRDAHVEMYEDDKLKDTLTYNALDSGNRFGYYGANWAPVPGHKYQIKVSSPQYGFADATDVMPNVTQLTNSDVLFYPADLSNNPQAYLTTTINDQPEDNYYRLTAFTAGNQILYVNGTDTITQTNYQDLLLNSVEGIPDTSIEYYGHYIFSDKSFKNRSFPVRFMAGCQSAYSFQSLEVVIYFAAISKSMYEYYRTLQIARNGKSSSSSEPTFVYSNVNNGYGIFGASTYTIAVLPVK